MMVVTIGRVAYTVLRKDALEALEVRWQSRSNTGAKAGCFVFTAKFGDTSQLFFFSVDTVCCKLDCRL